MRDYTYEMGFRINGIPIPDPSTYSGAQSDLDTLGERDATGRLRRNKVATKRHVELEWNNIEWSMVKVIGEAMGGKKDRFPFCYPDPLEDLQTITAYCGDRNWTVTGCRTEFRQEWIGTLKVKIVEI